MYPVNISQVYHQGVYLYVTNLHTILHNINMNTFSQFLHGQIFTDEWHGICTECISSLGRQDLVTQLLVKIFFLYKLVAKKLDFVTVQIADFNLKR